MIDVGVIIPFTFLALLHLFGIVVGFYSLFLPQINPLNKQIAYCGVVGAGFPLFISDIMIIVMSARATNRDLLPLISLLDVYSSLVFNFFIPQLIWGKLVQVFRGIAPQFYETCSMALSIKVLLLTLGSFAGLALCAISDKYYLPLFCLIQNAYSIASCFTFVAVVYLKLRRMDMIFPATGSRKNSDSNSLTAAKVSDISMQSSVPRKSKDGFEKATYEFRIIMYLALCGLITFIVLAVVLGTIYYDPDSVRSGYVTSIPWKFQSGIAAMNIPLAMIISRF